MANKIEDILNALDNLDRKIALRLQAAANRKVLKDLKIVQQLKDKTPEKTGKSAASIKLRSKKGAGIVAPGPDGYPLRFIERGTVVRKTKKGANRGSIERKPFIQQTYKSNQKEIFEKANQEYEDLIIKALERNIKNIKKKLGR